MEDFMQEMVNFEGLDIKKSKNKRMAHYVKISTLLKNKDFFHLLASSIKSVLKFCVFLHLSNF